MTNTQLYIAICVPVLALIFSMVTNFALISRIEKRIDDLVGRMDERGDRLDKRIDEMGARLDKRIDDLKEVLRAEMQRDHSEVMSKFADVERRIERLEG